jgi:hypothetical protein
MKYDCGMIRDLLPLVQDDMASPASQAAAAEHIEGCEACRVWYEGMKQGMEQNKEINGTEDTDHYKSLARRLRLRKMLTSMGLVCIVGLVLITSIAYTQGVRFNAEQAAATSRYVDEQSTLLGEVEVGAYKVFFYENEDKYRTVLTKERYGLWKNSSSSWANKTEDPVKLVGWSSVTDRTGGQGVTAIPVQSFDHQVAYIEMGPEKERQRLDLTSGETVIFAWDSPIRWNDLNGIAYSGDGKPLYKLGYETANQPIRTDELRWLAVKPGL